LKAHTLYLLNMWVVMLLVFTVFYFPLFKYRLEL
jgi:hypothetical protein